MSGSNTTLGASTARLGPVQPEALARIRELYDAAVSVAKPRVHQLHMLNDQLAEAVAARDAAQLREDILSRALLKREQQVQELTARLGLEQAQRDQDGVAHTGALALRDQEIEQLRATASSLRSEVAELQTQVALARTHTADLEQIASDVEGALARVEGGTAGIVPEDRHAAALHRLGRLRVDLRYIEKVATSAEVVVLPPDSEALVRLVALREDSAVARSDEADLDELIGILTTDLLVQELVRQTRPGLFRRLSGERPFAAVVADFRASVLCLTISALHRSRGQSEEQEKLLQRAGSYFYQSIAKLVRPSMSGTRVVYRVGGTAPYSTKIVAELLVRRQRVITDFETCRGRLDVRLEE
ncbi:hypothetical protein [Streptomyces sp. NBC_00690]|uniref:hypothetical protein n=1 Tax=Streptomyces sp. NBC_00690 TaxID=2975808 RepID=UPI002E2B2846|nr:hypothetical protein [Streptomyces sp. NBC_00690]